MWPGGAPDLERLVADRDDVALVDRHVDLAPGHRDVDVLGVDPGVGQDLVALFERGDALGVRGDLALEDLAGPGQALGVVGVGVGGQDHLAGREAEVHLADQLEHVGQLVEEADVDQRVLGAAVDQVDVHPQPAPGLDVHLDHAGENVVTFDHPEAISSRNWGCSCAALGGRPSVMSRKSRPRGNAASLLRVQRTRC